MAYTTHIAPGRGALAAVQNFFALVGNALVLAAESSSRMQRLQALTEMSDAELEKRGIRREDIFRSVYRDVLYL